MCNTKNIEQIRQQIWCDFYLQTSKEVNNKDALLFADNALIEFDKRFNDKFETKETVRFVFGSDRTEIINTDREPPIVDTSTNTYKQRKPLRDVTTYIERGLKPIKIHLNNDKNMITFERCIELMKLTTPVFSGNYIKGKLIECYPVDIKSVGVNEVTTTKESKPLPFEHLFESEKDFFETCLKLA